MYYWKNYSRQITAVDRPIFYRFLLNWHHLTGKSITIQKIIKRYSGWHFAVDYLLRELLPNRLNPHRNNALVVETPHKEVVNHGESKSASYFEMFVNAIDNGEFILLSPQEKEKGDTFFFFLRGQGNLFDHLFEKSLTPDPENKNPKAVYSFLKENGTSPYHDIELGSGISGNTLNQTLQTLLRAGEVTTNNYPAFIHSLKSQPSSQKITSKRHKIKQKVQNQLVIKESQWFSTSSFAVLGKKLSDQERIEHQARLLLLRHGILVKEWYRRENGFAPWFQIFQALKKLEWQGEILRGYFIKGLSGVQYALPEAIELLKSLPDMTASLNSVLLSTIDPALPFGGHVAWDLSNAKGDPLRISRLEGNHLLFIQEQPRIYSENYGRKLWTLQQFDIGEIYLVAEKLKDWLRLPPNLRPIKKSVIREIDGIPAIDSSFCNDFLKSGYEVDGKTIVLWPSGV